jgi:dolichyl-diphosphooligosaccharide--protein glycosyltransferase/undecaprenyl-diphosphooligosaccharide--protein glycosyltransferase
MMKMEKHSRIYLWLSIVISFLFGIGVRYIWVMWAQKHPEFFYNAQLMINTNDGYLWAASAQHHLNGAHAYNPRLSDMLESATVFLTVMLTKYTPLSLETVILYMPAFVSSLIVIPIILIGSLYRNVLWGFLAALLAVVTWSFYNRTMIGYYDTDMFAVMSATFILYFLIASVERFTLKSALYAAMMIAFYPFLYDQGKAIVAAMGLIYFAYLLFYHRKEALAYQSILLVSVGLFPAESYMPELYASLLKTVIIIALYAILRLKTKKVATRMLQVASITAALVAVVLGDAFGIILHKVLFFLNRETTQGNLHFLLVNQTVREAGHIPFETFANRISGSVPGFIFATIGYLWMLYKRPAFLLSLPLVGIGFFAWFGGLRFTVYAVPVFALAAIFIAQELMRFISDKPYFRRLGMGVVTALMLIPNISHIQAYQVPTVLRHETAKALETLNKQASSKDYTIAWWDYGYPIWFYSDTNTLIDGGKHQNDNYIVSKILQTDNPLYAANFSRLAVESYVESNYSTVTSYLFGKDGKGRFNPEELDVELSDEAYIPPAKTREIYLYLPAQMFAIFPTVMRFGNIDLKTGNTLRKIIYEPMRPISQQQGNIFFDNGLRLDMQRGLLIANGENPIPLKSVVIARQRNDGKVEVHIQPYSHKSKLVMVYAAMYGVFILMDEKTYRSLYVQMFLLDKYDARYFEPVVHTPMVKIYRIKR